MDDSSDSRNWTTLASVLSGALGGYVDAQNSQPVTVTAPGQQTAYGYAGYSQGTGTAVASASMPSWVLLAGLGLVAFLLLKR